MTPSDPNDELEVHLRRVRLVNEDFQIPLIDFWDPAIVDQMDQLIEKNGRITGAIEGYRLQYYEGDNLPIELNILDRDSGRRIAQDGSTDPEILTLLRKRLERERNG